MKDDVETFEKELSSIIRICDVEVKHGWYRPKSRPREISVYLPNKA